MPVSFDSWLKGSDNMAGEDLSPLSAETCTVPNSESPELDVLLSSLRKKKRKKKKKKCELENNDKSCESPSVQSQPVQVSDQEASQPHREKNITITDLGSTQSNVELSLSTKKKKKKKGCETSEINDTSPLADSGSPQSNVELSLSAKKKKKKKKKGYDTFETYDTSCGSPSLQPQLVQLSDQQAPQPLTEKITTITDSESPQSNVELSLPQNKNKKKNKGCKAPETNDQEVKVSQPIEDLSFSVKSKKRIGKKSCKDEVCSVSVMESNMPAVAPCIQPAVEISLEQLVVKPPVGGISTTTNSKSPNPDADFGCSQETKKKKRKRSHKTDEDKELSVKTMMAEADPSFQPSLAMVSEQEAQVSRPLNVDAQPLVEGMSRTVNSENPLPNADFNCSQETKKKKRKRGLKVSNSKELLEEVMTPEADPSIGPSPNADAEPPVEGMIMTTNSESLKHNADISCPIETKKKKQKRGCKTTCGGDTDAAPPVESKSATMNSESLNPNADISCSQETKKKKQKRGHKTTCDAEPLVEGRSATMNSESLKPGADISCSQEIKKKKKQKRGRKTSDSKELLVEVMKPEADPSLQPLLAICSEHELEVPPPLNTDAEPHVEGVNVTTNSDSLKPNGDIDFSKETKKKKRKRGGKASESKELLVEVMTPEADPSVQPLLAIFYEHELEVPPPRDTDAEPPVEGMNVTMKPESPKLNADISCSKETKKKNRKRKHKTSESNELLVEIKTPEADASLQPNLAEKEPEVLQPLNTDAEPPVEGMNVTRKPESPKSNEDISFSQETKKKNRKRKHKISERKELLVEIKTLEADTSLQPNLAEKEPEVPQPLNTDAEPLLEGMSTTMKLGSLKPNEDISFSQETKKKNRKRKHKTSESKELLVEIMTPEADPSLHPSPAIQEVEVSPLKTDAQPLTEGVRTETSETPKPSAAFGCSQEKKKKNPKKKLKSNENTELLVEGTITDTYPSLQSPLSIFSEQKVEVALPLNNGIERKETKIDEVPSLSHLSPITDTEVVAISRKGNLLQMSNLSPERSLLNCSQKKLLILDINGLLADIVQMEVSIPSNFKPDKIISRKAVFKRPFCDDFLQFCFDRFNVGVWSSRTKYNVDIFIDFLLGDSKHKLLFCWNQSHCTSTRFKTEENKNKPLVLKELRKLWENLVPGLPWARGEYNESNTLLVDDSPYKALRNPVNTAIFPISYQFRNSKDSSLAPGGDIRSYLEGLATAENVQKYVEQNPFGQQPITESNPSWNFYWRVIQEVKPLR